MGTDLVTELKSILPASQLITGKDLQDRYAHIWEMDRPIEAMAIAMPKSTAEVAGILKCCYRNEVTVVVHGGLTNLVGSTRSTPSDLIVSMEKMNAILELDQNARNITVQAGVILESVQDAAAEADLLFPLNFGAKGSAQIGGIIASNAGGLRVIKYGMTRDLVMGLEVVLADGTVINSLKKLVKNNTGYDLKQLFIGSEGTLGIVTAAVLKLVEKPSFRGSALVGLDSYDQVIQFFRRVDINMAGALSAFEIMWLETYRALSSPPSTPKAPLPYTYNFYVLFECMGGSWIKDTLEEFLIEEVEKDRIRDAMPAFTQAELDWFWMIREDVGPMTGLCKNAQQFDISMSPPLIGEYVQKVLSDLSDIDEIGPVFPFGHVGDGNIHLIVGKQTDDNSLTQRVNEVVYGHLQGIEGSVSAEHGIGLDKRAYLSYSRSPQEIALMRSIKKALDPRGILNPGRIFALD
ncbi:MAG: FAD-binding oxidoreductase [Saprospiraceae bacterium]|nr:FAD-binding oxidoreductase [Saprospiraceae bacterium]